jgi:HAE1 family hydrophobic/amphiphilic exporter-1
LVGIIGLIGIVVNDSLVWVDCYNHLREGRYGEPLTAQAAAVQAVKQRFRPIMLTTLTTVLGLAPVALSTSAGIAGSMASTIVCGLIASSVMLLLFLPVCVVIIEDLDRRVREASVWRRFTSFNGLALDKSRQIE